MTKVRCCFKFIHTHTSAVSICIHVFAIKRANMNGERSWQLSNNHHYSNVVSVLLALIVLLAD